MKIDRIDLHGFKRFTDTSIQNVPEHAKLVMLIGPNGSGKSSLIDAVYNWYSRHYAGQGGQWDRTYHEKQEVGGIRNRDESVNIRFHGIHPSSDQDRKKAIYVRSAYRNDPEFEINNLGQTGAAVDERRFNRLIENDQVVARNYQRLVSTGFSDMFDAAKSGTTLQEFTDGLISEIRSSMATLFPGLVLNNLGNPLNGGTFTFTKGSSSGFMYKNLSGGEKAAFDLLLDILIKRKEFDNTVYFIDEPEAHMAAGLQSALLAEMFRLVPDNSQLWIATHSIGMMRKAREIHAEQPGSVAFLDFDGKDFDASQILSPVSPDRPFWKRAFQIALDDLSDLVAPDLVFLCEGGRFNGGKAEFDAQCYNTIFQQEFPSVLFIGAGNAADVERDRRALSSVIQAVAQGVKVRRLIDRDDRTEFEISTLNADGVRVLLLRSIESYLLSEEILKLLCRSVGKNDAATALLEARKQAIEQSVARGNAPDDLKSVAGEIYVAAKKLLPESKLGSTSAVFQVTFCAPLVAPGTATYTGLREAIFGESIAE